MPWRIALWDYALALYGSDGVSEACLCLQDDFGADVCEILWACWLAYHGLTPDLGATAALAPIRRWQEATTRPLRHLRRRLKLAAAASDSLTELRETIKRAELLAERETLMQLQRLTERGEGIRQLEPGDSSLSRRLLTYLIIDDERALIPLTVLETHLDPGASP